MAKKKAILIKNSGKNGSFTIRSRKQSGKSDSSLSDVVLRIVKNRHKSKAA